MTSVRKRRWRSRKKQVIFEKNETTQDSIPTTQYHSEARYAFLYAEVWTMERALFIGRLLYDIKSIFEDQYEAIKTSSEQRGEQGVNLALLTDGLRAEREQGITIDVAYRYFSLPTVNLLLPILPVIFNIPATCYRSLFLLTRHYLN